MGQAQLMVSDSESESIETSHLFPPSKFNNRTSNQQQQQNSTVSNQQNDHHHQNHHLKTTQYSSNSIKLSIFDQIPSEVIIDIIFSLLGSKCLFGVCRLVCRRWNEYIIQKKNGLVIGNLRLADKKSKSSFIKSCRRGSLANVEGIVGSGSIGGDETVKHLTQCCGSNLKKLMLSDPHLSFDSVKNISKLSQLTVLELNLVRLGSEGANLISKINNLTRLHLVANEISDEGCQSICKNLLQLNYLTMNRNNITDEGIRLISNLSRLNFLSLNENDIGCKGMDYITQVFTLKELDLCINKICSKGFVNISNLKSLEKLRISFNLIDNEGVGHLSSGVSSTLTFLDVSFNSIGDEGAKLLATIQSLRKLRLVGNTVSEEVSATISRNLIEIGGELD